nr:EOG090X08WB [Sida crystallina]
MATVRDSDTSLWLHNKLGTSNDSWAGGSICSQLNPEVLKNIQECFVELQTQVKLKFLLSYFQLSRRNLEEWRVELEEILEVALVDGDPWVSMMAEILKTYPASGAINTEVGTATDEDNRRIFNDLANELRKLVKKHGETGMLPLECPYLNKTALFTVVGQQTLPVKHFTLKRKPKSAALRAELLQKSTDAQNNLKKNPAPTVPLRSRGIPRKMTDTTPLKGIPSQRSIGGFASSALARGGSTPSTLAGRKDGGIKLLDITEQPIGFAQAKKRKRQQELEAAQKAATEAQTVPEASGITRTSSTEEEVSSAPEVEKEKPAPTPDYAAGLLPSNPPPTPAPAPPALASSIATLAPIKETSVPSGVRVVMMPAVRAAAPAAVTSVAAPTTPTQMVRLVTAQTATGASSIATPTVYRLVQPAAATGAAQPAAVVAVNPPGAQPAAPKKSVSLMLTREQMQEAQEMFRNANKVTRPEKALILGFMAGSRENPCPHLGNIVTIKLSEDDEEVKLPDGTTATKIVETHFQMNYQAGEWKRIKKFRMTEDGAASATTAPAATAPV